MCTSIEAKHFTESLILEKCAALAGPVALNNPEGCTHFLIRFHPELCAEALKMFAEGDPAPLWQIAIILRITRLMD